MANEEKKMYVTEIRKGIYLMDEAHEATGYLVVGEERACMIDTMNAYTNLREEVEKLTDKPVYVVNTHGHGDHIFGNVYFDEAYIEPADRGIVRMFLESPDYVKLAEEKGWKMPLYKEIHEGDKLDLGGRTLEIYSLPGHTPGGILLLLKEDRVLFSGDSINHHLWMQLPGCLPLHEYVKKLDRIMFLEEKADIVVHGHARGDWDDISLLRCMRNGIQEICDGKTENDQPYKWFGGTDLQHAYACESGKHYSQDESVICYRKDKI